MTKEEFLELAERFQNNQCSDIEKNVLFEYCEQVQFKKWSLTKEEETRIRLLQKIHKSIKLEQPSKTYSWQKIGVNAAVFIGLISIGLFFYNKHNVNTSIVPTDQISLQLENGRVIIFNDPLPNAIFDDNGVLIARLELNKLIYPKTVASSKAKSNTLYIPDGKTFKLQLADDTQIQLNAGTSINYPVHFESQEFRKVAIKGEAYLDVAKDSLHPFIVDIGELSVKVLGTKFNIDNYQNNAFSEVVLAEGSVGLYTDENDINHKPSMLLSPGYKVAYNKTDKNLSKKKVNVKDYTAWVEGKLIYKNMPFGQILKKLERHFNVSISCENKSLSEELFNANLGENPSLNKVLEDFKLNYGMHYTIDGNQIIIK